MSFLINLDSHLHNQQSLSTQAKVLRTLIEAGVKQQVKKHPLIHMEKLLSDKSYTRASMNWIMELRIKLILETPFKSKWKLNNL